MPQAKVLSPDISQRPNANRDDPDFHSEANAPVPIAVGSVIEVSDECYAALGPDGEGKLCSPDDNESVWPRPEPPSEAVIDVVPEAVPEAMPDEVPEPVPPPEETPAEGGGEAPADEE